MEETIIDWFNNKPSYGIFYPPMKPEEFINFIKDYLLDEDWYTINPVNAKQIYTEILIAVLEKYSKKYKKEKRKNRWKLNMKKLME